MNMKSKGGLNQWTASRRRSLEGLKSREHAVAKAAAPNGARLRDKLIDSPYKPAVPAPSPLT